MDTVIVDEIHAVARDKRGSHLALTLERLEALCDTRPARIGLSATQRPIETVARLLVGDRPLPQIVDAGHQRDLDLAIELPDGELEAIASAEQMADVLDQIASHVREHRTTLVFVNTRSLAERVAHQLGERLGDDVVAAHHGSLSKDRRHRVETRLRVERVPEFLEELIERMRAQHREVGEKIAAGEWSDEIQKAVHDAVAAFAEDFGYDLDEEGQPLEEAAAA